MKKLLILLIFGVIGCTGRKEVAVVSINEAIVNSYWANQVSFEYLSLKGKINIESPNLSQTANINIRMKKDSVIWMSVSLVGFEGLRVLITKDSFQMINRMNGTYMTRPASYFNEIIGFDAELIEIQNIMLGNAPFDQFVYGLIQMDSSACLSGHKAEVVNELVINRNGRTFSSNFSSDFRAEKAEILYSGYEHMGPLELPSLIKGSLNNGMMESFVDLSYSSASTDPIASFPFVVPENARKI